MDTCDPCHPEFKCWIIESKNYIEDMFVNDGLVYMVTRKPSGLPVVQVWF